MTQAAPSRRREALGLVIVTLLAIAMGYLIEALQGGIESQKFGSILAVGIAAAFVCLCSAVLHLATRR